MLMPMLAEGMTGNIHIGLAALGAAIGVGLIGMKASEAVGRNPGAATPILVQAILSTAFAEGIVLHHNVIPICGLRLTMAIPVCRWLDHSGI